MWVTVVCCIIHRNQQPLSASQNVSESPQQMRKLLTARQKSPLPLSKSLDPDQASPTNDKKLLASKWSALTKTDAEFPPGKLVGSASAVKTMVAELDEEYKLKLTRENKETAVNFSDAKRTLAGDHPTFFAQRSTGYNSRARNAGVLSGASRLGQQSREELEETTATDELVESLFFVN